VFVRKDITDLNPNEILHQMANELLMWDPDVKVVENGGGSGVSASGSGEWELGDNVEW